jgi:hypothetical protein
MINPLEYVITNLVNDTVLAGLMQTSVPNKNIFTGDADIVRETQPSFEYPMIIIHTISDMFRVMPLNARDMHIQLDIMDRTSELEVVNIYEQLCNNLAYTNSVQGGTKIWWTRPDNASDVSETEMRIYHIRMDVVIYYYDNTPGLITTGFDISSFDTSGFDS